MTKKVRVSEAMDRLDEIVAWFERDGESDVEEGLEKLREGVLLVKSVRTRLGELENEFEDVRKELETMDGSA